MAEIVSVAVLSSELEHLKRSHAESRSDLRLLTISITALAEKVAVLAVEVGSLARAERVRGASNTSLTTAVGTLMLAVGGAIGAYVVPLMR